jgi:hypothetical protein
MPTMNPSEIKNDSTSSVMQPSIHRSSKDSKEQHERLDQILNSALQIAAELEVVADSELESTKNHKKYDEQGVKPSKPNQ